jgi:hypothetical protein
MPPDEIVVGELTGGEKRRRGETDGEAPGDDAAPHAYGRADASRAAGAFRAGGSRPGDRVGPGTGAIRGPLREQASAFSNAALIRAP